MRFQMKGICDKNDPKMNKYRIPSLFRQWKLLLSLVILACILYAFLYYASDQQISTNNRGGGGGKALKRKLTVVINTFKRHEMMEDAIRFYSSCEVVKYVHIIWSEKEAPQSNILLKYRESDTPSIIFDIQSNDSLNNRFKPLQTPHTDAIFSVDDDMRVPCSELELAFEVWQSSPRTLVGFMPRTHIRRNDALEYRCWWRVWWDGAYSIILTKAAILHHDYFRAYFEVLPKEIFTLVDTRRNCEDIAMQFLIANISNIAPIYIKGHLRDLGVFGGISTSANVVTANHMRERDSCLNDLVKIFDRNPLIKSHVIVDSASNGWTNSPSTWFEYLSSDLWKW